MYNVPALPVCDLFTAIFLPVTADAATELHMSNSKLAEVEAAYTTQKSEVRHQLHLQDIHLAHWELSLLLLNLIQLSSPAGQHALDQGLISALFHTPEFGVRCRPLSFSVKSVIPAGRGEKVTCSAERNRMRETFL